MKITSLTRPQLIALLVQCKVMNLPTAKAQTLANLRGALNDECFTRLREVYNGN